MNKITRANLRAFARNGDVGAAVELAERARVQTLKGLLAQVCDFDSPVTPAIFDVCADAWTEVTYIRNNR